MPYASWSVVFGEQPSAAKWNILGTNDAYFSSYIDRAGFPIQRVGNSTTAVATGTTRIPLDDTIPQITEGDQYMTQAITPTATTSILIIEINALLNPSAAENVICALFQDATANALAAGRQYMATGGGALNAVLRHIMVAGTTSSTTFRFRAGTVSSGTLTFNGSGGAREFGAITKSTMSVTEYRP